ncbi:hypothetical protein [Frigoribacterium sp. PhB24]|uniref:MinD/ParA family ATP-binding protein n=1 Tax=Frigoribacterium sp. PhB24 TaxID=2485204 RepID=UPI0011CD93FD|nr:hypothetical protein [Frigoribacterium sp. PhB24]
MFGGASRASEYMEEDTIGAPTSRRTAKPAEAEGGLPVLPPMPGQVDAPVETATAREAPEISPAPPAAVAAPARSDSTSILFGGAPTVLADAPASKPTSGWQGFLAKLGLSTKPRPQEVARREHAERQARFEEEVRRAVWTRAVSVLVANRKGGVGKTPASVLLSGTMAAIKGGSVAVIDAADDSGALRLRAEGTPRLGMGELVRDIAQIKTAGQLKGYTAPQTSFADVIGSAPERPRLSGEDVVNVSKVVDEFYSIRVMDSGNVYRAEAFQGAVSVTDVLVIPITNAGDAVIDALELLRQLRAAGGAPKKLADTAVILRMHDGRPESPVVGEEVERLLRDAGMNTLLDIPYDAHIAERGEITLGKLQPVTREAFVAAAAAVVRTLQDNVSND